MDNRQGAEDAQVVQANHVSFHFSTTEHFMTVSKVKKRKGMGIAKNVDGRVKSQVVLMCVQRPPSVTHLVRQQQPYA